MANGDSGIKFGRVGSVGGLCLAAFLILFGITALMSIAIPAWVGAAFALAAGVLILVGR